MSYLHHKFNSLSSSNVICMYLYNVHCTCLCLNKCLNFRFKNFSHWPKFEAYPNLIDWKLTARTQPTLHTCANKSILFMTTGIISNCCTQLYITLDFELYSFPHSLLDCLFFQWKFLLFNHYEMPLNWSLWQIMRNKYLMNKNDLKQELVFLVCSEMMMTSFHEKLIKTVGTCNSAYLRWSHKNCRYNSVELN